MLRSAFFCKRMKHSCVLLCSLQKNLAFFCVLFCSLEKNGKQCIVLLDFLSHQKLKKRTEKNIAFFKRTEKNGTFRMEKNAVPNPVFRHHGEILFLKLRIKTDTW